MSRHLTSNITSAYIEAANRLRPKSRKRKIVVYVESYDDIFFWRNVLSEFEDEQMAFEVEYYGTPLTVYPDHSGYFAILEVDDRYSPKVKMYNIAKGTVGIMKVRKPMYKLNPMAEGDVIRLIGWKRKPAYQYVDGKSTVKEGVYDLWIQDYEIIKT